MAWTPREDRLLGTYRGRGMYWSEVAELLGRTELDVRQRSTEVRLPVRRVWAPDDLAFLKENYGRQPVDKIAATLRRTVASVRGTAYKLGLSAPQAENHVELIEFIRERHLLGWTDADMAAAWSAEHPDRTVSREWLCEVRRLKAKLPHNAYSDHRRRQVAAKTKEQCQAAGVNSLAEIRGLAYQQFGERKGWPGVFRPRLVQILNLLYEQGPHTREQIARAIGMPWESRGGMPASRRSLKSNGKGGSAMAELMRAGLVVRTNRIVPGDGSGKSVHLYAIAPGVQRRVS
jgi:hypothetical protein